MNVSNESVILVLSVASVLCSYWHHFLHWDFFSSWRKKNRKTTQNPKVVIMSWLINTLSDILISVRSERKQKGGDWRRTNLATHSLPELIRKTFYHEIWSSVLKAAANVCLYPQCALPQSAFRLHKMSALEWRFYTCKESMCLLLWVSKQRWGLCCGALDLWAPCWLLSWQSS